MGHCPIAESMLLDLASGETHAFFLQIWAKSFVLGCIFFLCFSEMPKQTIPPTNNLTATVILGAAIFKEN